MPTFTGRQIDLKLVYYGPARCGKTTNLQQIHRLIKPESRGRLMSMSNVKDDRTIFFDLLPIKVSLGDGRSVSAKLYTVPGQVAYNNTRKLVLQNVDGIVFVADSQRSAAKANAYSFQNLQSNLRQLQIDPDLVPLLVQFNKRDLPDVRPMSELEEAWKSRGIPVRAASAVRCEGVLETLVGILALTFRDLGKRIPAIRKYGVTERGFVERAMENFIRPESSQDAAEPVAPGVG